MLQHCLLGSARYLCIRAGAASGRGITTDTAGRGWSFGDGRLSGNTGRVARDCGS